MPALDTWSGQTESRVLLDLLPMMAWATAPDGSPRLFNRAWLAFRGTAAGEELRRAWAAVHPDDFGRCQKAWSVAHVDRSALAIDFRLRRHDGVFRWVRAACGPTYDAAGTFEGFVGTCIDVHEEVTRLEAKAARMAELEVVVAQLPTAVCVLDRELRVLGMSPAWRKAHGPLDEPVLGRSHYELYPDLGAEVRESHRRGLAGEVVRSDRAEVVSPDGTRATFSWEVRPWRTGAGELGGIVIACEDLTSRLDALDRLQGERGAAPAALGGHQRWSSG